MTEIREKKRKKKIALFILLVVLVVTTGVLIGTLAKYVTSEDVSDSAVAAKFGLNIPNTINLFSDSYTNVEADTPGKKIIAPGTSGQYAFAVEGTSEVAYKVEADITVTYSEEWGTYKPLEFSIDGTDWTDDLTEFETDLSSELASDVIDPNDTYSSTQTIYWRWPFHISSANDIKDTEIGVAAAEGDAPKVTVDIEVTALQVEE